MPTPDQSDLGKPGAESHLVILPLPYGKGRKGGRSDNLHGKAKSLAKADAALEIGLDLGLGGRAKNGPAPDLVVVLGKHNAGVADGSEIKHESKGESKRESEGGREMESGKQLVKRFRWWYWRSATDEAETVHGGLKDNAAAAPAAVHGDVQEASGEGKLGDGQFFLLLKGRVVLG
ncbi:hypothetical protein EMPG_14896 [Blastomyces silverae]|uniref:Uncharacterized protein n=1 Tax=Blastomyces silverae TaxID=2060906 RepID=A0A0H1BEY0_9EURO|nr:hypothetical protein EMPG_14896 [Blastomyces silverae]